MIDIEVAKPIFKILGLAMVGGEFIQGRREQRQILKY